MTVLLGLLALALVIGPLALLWWLPGACEDAWRERQL